MPLGGLWRCEAASGFDGAKLLWKDDVAIGIAKASSTSRGGRRVRQEDVVMGAMTPSTTIRWCVVVTTAVMASSTTRWSAVVCGATMASTRSCG